MEVPLTEAGLATLLDRLAKARESGDRAVEARTLLDLAFIVKWVRSDNEQSPFERCHTLSLEALSVYEQLGDKSGQIRALISASPFQARGLLDQAAIMAEETTEEDRARVMAAQARELALSERGKAKDLNLKAAEVFRRLENHAGLAGCLFSLAILDGTDAEKRHYALEASECYRRAGDLDHARQMLSVALMNSNEAEEVLSLEPLIRQAMIEAEGNPDHERECYAMLERMAEAAGDTEEAARLRQIIDEGKTPHEIWEESVSGAEFMIQVAGELNRPEVAQHFEGSLRELMDSEPPR